MEKSVEEEAFKPRNFLRREDSGLPEHREMIPRHFNMHPQREVGPKSKYQMGADDMRRFREELNESGNNDAQANHKDFYQPQENYPEQPTRPPKGRNDEAN